MSTATVKPPVEPTARPRSEWAHDRAVEADARARGRSLITQLQVALKTATTHDPSNVIFRCALDELAHVVAAYTSEGELHVQAVLDDFLIDQHKLRVDLACYHSFRYVRETFARLGVSGFTLRGPLALAELAKVIVLMARTEAEPETDGSSALNERLQRWEITALCFEPPRQDDEDDASDGKDRRRRALLAYEDALTFMKETMTNFVSGELVDVRRGKRLVQDLVDASDEKRSGFALAGLAAVKNFHPYTFNHIVNVCVLTIAFGQRLGLGRKELCQLGMGALFHDIGKLSVPPEVLDKVEPLTDEEWKTIQQHPLYATRHLLTLGNLTEAGVNRLLVALEHHMGYDLEGYPKFRSRDRIHIFSRIVAIVDAYDAMVSKRCYQKQMLPPEALKILLKLAGSRFDPLLVKAFIHCMGIYPIGSLVRLNTGEIAVVTSVDTATGASDRPIVRLVRDGHGRDLNGARIDLSASTTPARAIVRCLDPDEYGINVAHYTLWKDQNA